MKRISGLAIFVLLLTACGKDTSKENSTQAGSTALLSVSHSPKFDFGLHPVESITEKEFIVSNIGSGSATEMTGGFYLSLSFNYKGGSFPGEGGTCTDTVSAGTMCSIVVVFQPKMLGVSQTALVINYNNGSFDTSVNGPTLTGQGI